MNEAENTQTVTFTKILGKWAVTGPEATVVEGATVTVTKGDGSTKLVYIRSTAPSPIKAQGTMIGFFTDAAEHEAMIEAAQAQQDLIEASRIETVERIRLIEASIS